MRKIDNVMKYAVACFVAAIVSVGCEVAENTVEPQKTGREIILNASIPTTRVAFSQPESGTGLNLAWEQSDKLTVYTGSVGKGNRADFTLQTIGADTHAASFGGVPAGTPASDTKLIAIYHGMYGFTEVLDSRHAYTYFGNQDGTVSNLKDYMVMYAETAYGDGTNISLNFTNLISVLKLTFTFPETVAEGAVISSIGVTAASGLYSSVFFNPNEAFAVNTSASTKTPSLTATSFTVGADHKATVYLATAPATVTDMYGHAVIDDVTYVSDTPLVSSRTLEAGKVYNKSNITMVVDSGVASSFAGGDGSAENPYQISNVRELRYMMGLLNDVNKRLSYYEKSFCLTDDIDMGDGSIEWVTNNSRDVAFRGTFDGRNHTIGGTMKPVAGASGTGLFGYICNATIKNVHFVGTIDATNVAQSAYIGAIVGYINKDGVIENCSNSADIISDAKYIGGIVGEIYGSGSNVTIITACTNSGNISSSNTSSGSMAGGIVGEFLAIQTAQLSGCINKGNIEYSSRLRCGGLIGNMSFNSRITADSPKTANITACWSSANKVEGSQKGALAWTQHVDFTECYYKDIGIDAYYDGSTNYKSTFTGGGSFSGTQPTADQIAAMNAAWSAADPTSAYRFDDVTGEVVAK